MPRSRTVDEATVDAETDEKPAGDDDHATAVDDHAIAHRRVRPYRVATADSMMLPTARSLSSPCWGPMS